MIDYYNFNCFRFRHGILYYKTVTMIQWSQFLVLFSFLLLLSYNIYRYKVMASWILKRLILLTSWLEQRLIDLGDRCSSWVGLNGGYRRLTYLPRDNMGYGYNEWIHHGCVKYIVSSSFAKYVFAFIKLKEYYEIFSSPHLNRLLS